MFLALQEGRLPVGEQVTEFFDMYQNMVDRVTHLCYTQGQYAKLRGLNRANILLELDQELKDKSQGPYDRIPRQTQPTART